MSSSPKTTTPSPHHVALRDGTIQLTPHDGGRRTALTLAAGGREVHAELAPEHIVALVQALCLCVGLDPEDGAHDGALLA